MQGLLKHPCPAVHLGNVEKSEYNPGLWPYLHLFLIQSPLPPFFFLFKIASVVAILLQKAYSSFRFFPFKHFAN